MVQVCVSVSVCVSVCVWVGVCMCEYNERNMRGGRRERVHGMMLISTSFAVQKSSGKVEKPGRLPRTLQEDEREAR